MELKTYYVPDYYNTRNMSCTDLTELILGKMSIIEGRLAKTAYYLGNIIKYLYRFEFKDGVEDLKKCWTYFNRYKTALTKDLLSNYKMFMFVSEIEVTEMEAGFKYAGEWENDIMTVIHYILEDQLDLARTYLMDFIQRYSTSQDEGRHRLNDEQS